MKLRVFRALTRMTQEQLAQLLGISELSVIKYEQGQTIPSREHMLRIYRLTSAAVTPNDFFDLESVPVEDSGYEAIAQDQAYLTLGLISSSGCDGIDASLLLTDGVGFIKQIGSENFAYCPEFQQLLLYAKQAYQLASGEEQKAVNLFAELVASDKQQTKLLAYLERDSNQLIHLSDIIQKLTDLHVEFSNSFIKKLGYKPRSLDLIGFHGQTLYHAPTKHISLQVGDPQHLSDQLGISVVSNFRENDIAHGGQGSPFAPLFHRALATQAQLTPAVIVNLGSVSSVTLIGKNEQELYAYDAGPASLLIDRFVQERIGQAMDRDGLFALRGQVDIRTLAALKESSLRTEQGENYLYKAPPKSLNLTEIQLIPELSSLSLQDGCATLVAFSVECISISIDYFLRQQIEVPRLWILAGGSVANRALIQQLRKELSQKLGDTIKLQLAEQVGWNGAALDAPIFAYLAVRSLRKFPLSMPGTTGVSEPLTGGRLYLPQNNLSRASKKVRALWRMK